MSKTKLLFSHGADWTEAILDRAWEEIEKIAKEELKISYYPPEIHIVSANQMLDAYSSVGMPTFYKHWSFGKQFVSEEKAYKSGNMGLAYELVINSNPCIAYLMEENDAVLQTMVMAHASVGHSAVFKNSYIFKEKTDATAINAYLNFAKTYIKKCEEKHGEEVVELVLDACHTIQSYGVDRWKKPKKLSPGQEEARALARFEQELKDYDHVWETVGKRRRAKKDEAVSDDRYSIEPQENLLYFIEKNAPHLPNWKREIIRIVRKVAEYFSPQGPTKVLNEGYASFCHFYIMERLYEKGLLDAGTHQEFLRLHRNVVNQHVDRGFLDGRGRQIREKRYLSLNPYKLGFEIFMDIKRICEGGRWVAKNGELTWEPITDEDKRYFPSLLGKNWVEEVNYAMMNFKDETFILQYLSPRVARDLQLFAINDPSAFAEEYDVTHIASEKSFRGLRAKLADQYAMENRIPDIQITGVDFKGSRRIILEHNVKRGRPLDIRSAREVMKNVSYLWEYSASLKTIEYNEEGDCVPIVLTEPGLYSLKSV